MTTPIPCTPHRASPHQQQEIFYAFVNSIYIKRTISAGFTHVVEDYINHNPDTVGIAASFLVLDSLLSNPAVKIQLLHQAFAAPYGWVHFRIDGYNPEPTAIVDVFRFNGSFVAEHWDVIQQRPVNATNPHPLF
ncbi:hypothetical protein B0H14DRAFT_2598007 [Mycena olivaceomarginata]|nr:hypothetical protein B0H14DRAFT_2598007 [Mycena olivaceomarginata]